MRILGIFIIVFLFVSCKKDKTINDDCTDIEQPGEYFPAFPNSWWEYTDQNNNPIRFEISSNYEMCDGKCRPIFLNLDKCISKNSIRHTIYIGQGYFTTVSSPIYSLSIDSVLWCPVSFVTLHGQYAAASGSSDIRYIRITKNIDTSLIIDGNNYINVIEVYEYDKLVSNHRYLDYFAKGIGLIKRDSLNASDTTIHTQILKIEDYFIGN